MKVIVLGASGIIGSHMRLNIPTDVQAIWMRRESDLLHRGLDVEADFEELVDMLLIERPDVVVNLAGESRVDVVEKDPDAYYHINAEFPARLLAFCQRHNIHMIHVSTQAVFSGEKPPYHAKSSRASVNAYGRQKIEAEERIEQFSSCWTIVRPTFVLGVRPVPTMGRENPIEQMLSGKAMRQVDNRFFSVSFAYEVARTIWDIAVGPAQMTAVHVGIPERVSRFDLMVALDEQAERISHESFTGIAPRPIDTTYAGQNTDGKLPTMLKECQFQYSNRQQIGHAQRAKELALFLGKSDGECALKLSSGFGSLHGEVAADFRKFNPKNDDELLEWYRQTEAYLWELSAYHCDPGFNYSGMCKGISEGLKAKGVKRVLCLGEGIGDLALTLIQNGFDVVYHDLQDSKTSQFAGMRIWMYTGHLPEMILTPGWDPTIAGRKGSVFPAENFDAVCSLDFLEHVTDVPAWTQAIHDSLKPGGFFFAQNAFNCGSGEDGSIPMHLTRNDKYETEWLPLVASTGFDVVSDGWYQKKSQASEQPEPYASVVTV